MTKFKKPKISIKYKIWLAIMSTVLIIIGGLWFMQVIFLEKYYLKIKKNELLKNTKDIVHAINSKGLENSGDDLLKIGLKNTLCIDVSDINGIRIVGYEGLGDNCFLHMSPHYKVNILINTIEDYGKYLITDIKHPQYDTRFYTSSVIVQTEDGYTYSIFVTATLAPVKEAAAIIRKQLIYISIVLVLVSTAISFLIARSLTNPIRKLSYAARQIAQGDLNSEIKIKRNDELGDLSHNFNYMQRELAKVNILQKELVANISHDIRTPLTMIKGYAEAIKDITGDDKQMREHQLDIIVDEANRLNVLVNDVMDLSLMQAGQMPLNIEPFDIKTKISDILRRFELLEQTKGFTFTFEHNMPTFVLGDEKRIEQVLYNLIGNAINHAGEQKHITVVIKEEFSNIIVEIIDTGEGIKQEDLPLIWDRYYKPYKKVGNKQMGTGLGLSIVKAILIGHGKSFGVKSLLGTGSTFWFSLQKANVNETGNSS